MSQTGIGYEMSDLCLCPSPSSSDYILSCPVGDISFKKYEYEYYNFLFQALDSDDDGRIRYKDAYPFLKRSGVTQEFLLLVWDDVCIYKEADIVLEQWLLLCKNLAYAKKNSNFCTKPTMQRLVSDFHAEEESGSTLDMFLHKVIEKFDIPPATARYSLEQCPVDIDIVSWENIVGSSITESSYSLYNIRYSTILPHFSLPEGGTRRRYSDFAFLVQILQRRFRGVLVPPLPPKYDHLLDTKYLASQNKSDHVAQSRANDLSIFLKHISRHPILSLSLEFMIFLQASTAGFASFRTALKSVTKIHEKNTSVLDTSVDDVVLMALSTSTAVTGFATSMFGAVNNLLGMSMSQNAPNSNILGEDLDTSEVEISQKFSDTFARMLQVAKSAKKASAMLDELIQIDKSRVDDIAQIAQLFEKSGKFPNNKAFNLVVSKYALEYDGISSHMFRSLELQKIEVSNQLLNIGRFYFVLKTNQENRDADIARLNDKKNEVICYRKQLASAKTMSSIKPIVLSRLEASIEEATDNFADMKIELNKSFEATERDVSWLASLIHFELQGRMLGFVQMRAAACQTEAEALTKLYDEISKVTV